MGAENEEEQGVSVTAPKAALAQPQNAYPQYRQGYPNQYNYNPAGQMQYGMPQQISPYQSYPSQNYMPYSYGYNQPRQPAPRQPASWNKPIEPLLGDKFWEYPTIKAKLPPRYKPQNGPFYEAPARPQPIQPIQPQWYQPQPIQPQPFQPQPQNYYPGRRPFRQWQQYPNNRWPRQPNPAPQPEAFDPTSEEYYQSEYSTGSVQASKSGIELIPTEMEKDKDGKVTKLSRARAWHNYHSGQPVWNLQKPIIPRSPQPVDTWTPRPDYIQPNTWPNQVSPRPDIVTPATQTQRTCLMNCRRRCGLGLSTCGWNKSCGGSGCRAARNGGFRPQSNGMGWNSRGNGQYWGAAAQWNNGQVTQQAQQPGNSSPSTVDAAEEKECSPEMANSGEWKWIDNKWKWVCKEKSAEEGSGDQSVIDAR